MNQQSIDREEPGDGAPEAINAAAEGASPTRKTEGGARALESQDGKSRIKLVGSGADKAGGKVGAGDNAGPVLVVGFPSAGLVGSISANYIIEKKGMHQIAFVDSEYVIPAAIYIGGRFRHPFRIYADDKRTLCVMVCEAPLRPEGVHSIMDLMVRWASRNQVREVLVLDGVPVRGLPGRQRKPLILSSSPQQEHHGQEQKPDGPAPRAPKGAMMVGLSGGLISACLSDGMPCTGVLIPSASGIPDPEGAAILLETVSGMPSVPLEIDVEPLRQEGQVIKRQLKEFIDSVRNQQKDEEGGGRYPRSSRIYG